MPATARTKGVAAQRLPRIHAYGLIRAHNRACPTVRRRKGGRCAASCAHPLVCRCSRMVSASTAMHATRCSGMRWPSRFQRSQRLGPSRSITWMGTDTVTSQFAMPCHAMPCHAMPCHAMPCHAMPCHAMYHLHADLSIEDKCASNRNAPRAPLSALAQSCPARCSLGVTRKACQISWPSLDPAASRT